MTKSAKTVSPPLLPKPAKLHRRDGGFEIRSSSVIRHSSFARTLLALFLATFSARAGTTFSPATDAGSRIDIRVESWLESQPRSGFAPVTVVIRNGDTQEHTWTISSANNGYGMGGGLTFSSQLTVPPGRSAARTIFAPVPAQPDTGYYYGGVSFTVRGHAVTSPTPWNLGHMGGYGSNRTEFIAMGKKTAPKGWSALRAKFSSGGSSASELDGSEVDMAQAPEDWRGYAGLAQLWMDETEWLGMSPASKGAMLDWVSLGGRVIVLATEASDARADQLRLPQKTGGNGPRRHGIGGVSLMRWDGNSLPLDAMVSMIRSAEREREGSQRKLLAGYDKPWRLRDQVGQLTLKSGLIFGFIVIFGVLVGPVNLFLFAPAGRRQRMFWTTPLISLAGSLVLMAVMILQDGIGGDGARLVLAILQPEEKRLAVMQEQVSRTGVLLGRSFAKTEPSWMQPLELTSTSTFNPVRQSQRTCSESESDRSGEWFASRAVQAHFLQTVRPSRASIEVHAPGDGTAAPSVLSSLECPLKKVFVVDERGVWTAEDLGTGERKPLKATTRSELDKWLRDGPRRLTGPVLGNALDTVDHGPGSVFAEASDASKLAVTTLSSIRWKEEHALIVGRYVRR